MSGSSVREARDARNRRRWKSRGSGPRFAPTRKARIVSGIKDKVIAITGASSGIGEATALLLADRGARVVLGARGSDRLAALAARIADQGGEVAYAPTDVRRRADLTALVALAGERFGTLDVLVNNAGVMPISPLADLRVEDWEAMIDINLKGVLYGIAAALPVFRAQGSGHFVNIASTAAFLILPSMSVYAGTKLAARHLGRTAPGGGQSRARDHHFARHDAHELRGRDDQSGGESPTRSVAGPGRAAAGRDRPRDCVRDRATGRCRCE